MVKQKVEYVLQHAGQTLDQIVAARAQVSLAEAHVLIRRGAVWAGRHRIEDPGYEPPAGARVTVHFPPAGVYERVAVSADDIVWENQALLALNKRPGWHANYTPWDKWGTLPHALAQYLRVRDEVEMRLHFLHQLDRDTSGVLLIGKDPGINPYMQQLFLNNGIAKTYLALVSGDVQEDAFELQSGHGRGKHGLFRIYPLVEVGRVLPFGRQRVRYMHTRFEVLERFGVATLVQAIPITGRTHQIRLHLAHIGHPLLGDTRYGGPQQLAGLSFAHHLLHAAQLRFVEPVDRQMVQLDAPLPPTWTVALRYLRAGKEA